MKFKLTISRDENGKPAYEVLSGRLNMSGLLIKKIRLYGSLLVNGRASRMKDPVFEGDTVDALYESDMIPRMNRDSGIKIYHEDEWIVVCEKPYGIVTHPSWQHMDDSFIQRLSPDRLHPVMRLDRETTGLIVVAKNGYAHNQIITGPMFKEYTAIVYGAFEPSEGTIDLPIGRSDSSIMIRIVRDDGKNSVTHYKTLLSNHAVGISMVRFVLDTGRCHQIRVHCRHNGHPLVGDGLYGPRSNDYPIHDEKVISVESHIERQALHAGKLSFNHPFTGINMSFSSPIPEDMVRLASLRTI
ncbi:MAG: RluA family pseudouridine synthase [Clostridiaceae bacterium]|nr:RluA family pseudouridine synthase [Clostridiaceae bacterium]